MKTTLKITLIAAIFGLFPLGGEVLANETAGCTTWTGCPVDASALTKFAVIKHDIDLISLVKTLNPAILSGDSIPLTLITPPKGVALESTKITRAEYYQAVSRQNVLKYLSNQSDAAVNYTYQNRQYTYKKIVGRELFDGCANAMSQEVRDLYENELKKVPNVDFSLGYIDVDLDALYEGSTRISPIPATIDITDKKLRISLETTCEYR